MVNLPFEKIHVVVEMHKLPGRIPNPNDENFPTGSKRGRISSLVLAVSWLTDFSVLPMPRGAPSLFVSCNSV